MGDEKLAEVCGIHTGDGYLRNKKYNRELDVSGSFEEEVYYDHYVIPLFSRVFKIKIEGRHFPSRRTYGFVIRDKKVVERMHALGFPYGAKSAVVKVPEFILKSEDERLKSAFLRGVLDTDGCLCFQRKTGKYTKFKTTHNYYPVIVLSTISENLVAGLKTLLGELNIHFWDNVGINGGGSRRKICRIWVKGKSFIKWMEIIGTKNPIQNSKYQIWKKYGHCPPRLSFVERLSILNEDTKIEQGPVRQSG